MPLRGALRPLGPSRLGTHAFAPPPEPRSALIVDYGTPPDHLFPGAVAALCRALAPA
ncbi:hypothetical protein [Streptomyces sp. SBT349]|uniref:hypothetical protein n=1 Tax=Streptomyces sp. SBT349 TaxID=1580539 RepID=UPI000A811AD4|nr:hypothetical protein [Streptomyces sp. SBT349]